MVTIKTANEVALTLADRVKQRRLEKGWTQQELADRAGVKPATYVLFERTGRISLLRFLKLLDVLGLLDEADSLGSKIDMSTLTLKDLTRAERKRGSRKQAL